MTDAKFLAINYLKYVLNSSVDSLTYNTMDNNND